MTTPYMVISCDQVIFPLGAIGMNFVAHTNHLFQRMYSDSCLAILEIYAECSWNDYWSIYSQSQRFYETRTGAPIMLSFMDCPALSLTPHIHTLPT